ncbi:MAG: hypothetical protein ACP5N2_05565 [Candidatus Nanoarchaeia archaeon]
MSGRKLPKKVGYKRDSKNPSETSKFPGCIGRFQECKSYTPDLPKEDRPECRICPYKT